MDMHRGNGIFEIGYIWFAPQMQRTRAATEALCLMIDHAMTDLRNRRMQRWCNSLNAKSRNGARRLGFCFEGIFHNHLIYRDFASGCYRTTKPSSVRAVLVSASSRANAARVRNGDQSVIRSASR